MRKVIEYTLVSADGVFEEPANLSVHPVFAGSGEQFFRDGQAAKF